MSALKTDNIEDVSYINDEYFEAEFYDQNYIEIDSLQTESEFVKAIYDGPWYGHDMSHDGKYYYFKGNANNENTSSSKGCGKAEYKLPMAYWNHSDTKVECGSHHADIVLKFTRRR
ncbi:hypothetical protein [Mangrovimonas sp. DI 80]|uniref:hypothetical protein n=1 Tax=Mangrovimonas sp. DI 80 TaxID=1779330 RepID=UPI000F4DBD70|nr:hypothetical protein [Mangrovimonas sp. DI 80]